MAIIAPTGATGKNAFGVATAWGTEVAASDLIVDMWMTMKEGAPNLNYPKGAGSLYKRSANPMEVKVDADIKGSFAVTQLEKLFKAFHGNHYRSSAIETTAYKHSYWLKDTTEGILTLAQHGGQGTVAAKVIDSVVLNTMKISGKDGDTPLDIEFKGIGRQLMRSPAKITTNTPTTINALTAPGVDAYEKKITMIHSSTASGLNAGYHRLSRIGNILASTAVVTSPGGGNATAGAMVVVQPSILPPETITATFSSATAFTVTGSIGGAYGSGTTGVSFVATFPATFLGTYGGSATINAFTITLTAGGSPMANGDTIVWKHYYSATATDILLSTGGDARKIFPTSIDFTVDKKMKGMPDAKRFISQPVTEDQRDIKLKFTIPSYEGTANDIFDTHQAYMMWRDQQYQQDGTIFYYKIDSYFEMPQLAGSTSQKYYLRLTIPRACCRVPEWNMGGPGLLPINLEFEVQQPFTVPADFAGFANSTTDLYPYGLELCNKLSTDT